MYLFSGVLAPVLHPVRPADEGSPAAEILRSTSGAERGWFAPGSSFLCPPGADAVIAVRPLRGVLLASGSPLPAPGAVPGAIQACGSSRGNPELVDEILALARAGGRIPAARDLPADAVADWRRRGFRVAVSGTSIRMPLGDASVAALRKAGDGADAAPGAKRPGPAPVGLAVEVVPEHWVPRLLEELDGEFPVKRLVPLAGLPAVVCRRRGRPVALGALVEDRERGELSVHLWFRPRGIRSAVGRAAAGGMIREILAGLGRWALDRGYADDFARLDLHLHGARLSDDEAPVLEADGVGVQPRYSARPPGLRGLVVSLLGGG